MRATRGVTLLEIVIALALAAVVVGLVGSLLLASLATWRRGRDLREAQAHAGVLADTLARDIRNASQAPGVVLRPRLPVDEGEPVLAVTPVAGPDAQAGWILYVFRRDRGEVVRHVVAPGVDGRPVVRNRRVVAAGVVSLTVYPADGHVTIETEVRRGRSTAQARTTAAPRNP